MRILSPSLDHTFASPSDKKSPTLTKTGPDPSPTMRADRNHSTSPQCDKWPFSIVQNSHQRIAIFCLTKLLHITNRAWMNINKAKGFSQIHQAYMKEPFTQTMEILVCEKLVLSVLIIPSTLLSLLILLQDLINALMYTLCTLCQPKGGNTQPIFNTKMALVMIINNQTLFA